MKIIDVLNKITNGEEFKFKTLCDNEIYYVKDGILIDDINDTSVGVYVKNG